MSSVGFNWWYYLQVLNKQFYIIHLHVLFLFSGVDFAVYCVTYIVLPTIQRWLLSHSQNIQIWDKQGASFKQYCGFITHLIVKLLNHLQGVDLCF